MDKKMVTKFNIAMYIFAKMVIIYFFVFIYQGCSVKKIKTGIDTCEVIVNKTVYDTVVIRQVEEIVKPYDGKSVTVKITERKTGKTMIKQILPNKIKLIDTTKFKVIVIYEQGRNNPKANAKNK